MIRVTTAALPKSATADLTVEVRRYSGPEVEAAYPVEWKGAGNNDIFTVLMPHPNEAAVTWYYLLHASRQGMSLPDGLIYSYFMTDYLGYRGGVYGTYSMGSGSPGLFYTARDITGAWGPMHYEEPDLSSIALSDPKTIPTSGEGLWLPEYYGPQPSYPDNPNPTPASTSSINTHTIDFGAPVRFSSASFMLAESEIARYNEIKAREAAMRVNTDEGHSVAGLNSLEDARISVLR